MQRIPVQSSNLREVGFEAGVLEVEFTNGKRYRYRGVSQELFSEFMAAESKGSFFARNIRGKFEGEAIEA